MGRRRACSPKVRVVGLGECGSHAIVGAAMGSCRVGEQTLAPALLGALEPDMLVMADRNFFSYALWRDALATGAALLWRVSASVELPVIDTLDDGS